MIENYEERIIGVHEGKKNGPLLICFGAMHGNEPAGVKAIDLVLKMLEIEPVKNPNFEYNGTFLGIIGNLQAYKKSVRFIQNDLNRQFREIKVKKIRPIPEDLLKDEELELIQVIRLVETSIKKYQPNKIIVLDLHTTSSHGGIFTICKQKEEIIKLAMGLHAPVVLGMLEGLKGTTLHYFNTENMGVNTTALTFESGQHEEEKAINRAIAGIICCMREIKAVRPEDVENYHEKALKDISEHLPVITTLIDRHEIEEGEVFQMKPGFTNFQKVNKGELLANNQNGNIYSKEAGRILMPLYQSQGEDGFFLIKDI